MLFLDTPEERYLIFIMNFLTIRFGMFWFVMSRQQFTQRMGMPALQAGLG